MDKQAWHAATLLLLAATNLNCSAGQRKEVRDGLAVEAIVSEREATRIRVEDAMITGVVGKIQLASGCNVSAENPQAAVQAPMQPSNPMAEASITCDLAKGEIYLRPLGTEKKPINLFVSTDRATYTLVLRRADLPSDTVVLFDPSAPRASASKNGSRAKPASHVKGIKSMLRAMLATPTPDDVQAEDVKHTATPLAEASLTLVRNYRGRGLLGERYQLTNTSASPMTLTEQEFDREGAGVIAVAIDSLNLRPGESTWVHIIRSEGQP